MSVLTYSVYSCIFYPPYTALDKITGNVTVSLIQIRHNLSKPSVCSYGLFIIRGMNIHYACCLERCLDIIGTEIKPIILRSVLKQIVLTSAMIENHIHNNFQSFIVSFIYQFEKFFVTTKTSVYLIVVSYRISMI